MERLIAGGTTAEPRDALANIVFVHGIGSSGETAWKSSESKAPGAFPNWLWEDLEKQTAAPINVWVANYPAEVFRLLFYSLDRDDSVPQRGRMLRDLVLDRIADRPVIFIAHSLGGIMVKQMLRAAMDMRHQPGVGPFNLALSTKLVVFLATPHAGSSIANLAMAVPAFAGTVVQSLLGMVDWLPMSWPLKVLLTPLAKRAVKTGPFTNSLKRDDPHLEDLAAWYRNNAVPLGIETRAYHENLKYAIHAGRFKGRTLMVVEKASANPGVSGCDVVPLEGDHGTVCKPTSRTDPNYTVILNVVKTVVDKRCPAFAQTHQAIFDAGETFVRLTELKNTADRLVKTKVVVHPIEKVLGRDAASVEYQTSFGTREGFKPEPWQLKRAYTSPFDLDRIILYVHSEYMGCQGGGLSVDQLADCVRQEFEDLRAKKNADQRVSFIPLHYAIRALRKEVARSRTKATSEVRDVVSEVRELVSQMAHGTNQHREILTNLSAILNAQE